MADKEVFQTMRNVVDALEKEFDSIELSEDFDDVELYSSLYGQLTGLTDCLNRAKKKSKTASSNLVLKEIDIDAMAALAKSFDESGDEFLMKQASVIDIILRSFGALKKEVSEAKKSQDIEVEKIKQLIATSSDTDPYTVVKAVHDKQNKVEEARKEIADRVKSFRPLEAPLMTRTCPDHPGAQMARISENTFQCSLDKAVFNYEAGYSTMKGNKVPGGSVMNQTQDHDRPNEFLSFDSRESRLNK